MADEIKYLYALDEQGKTVCIDDVSDEDKSLHTYYCMNCNATMIPRRGKIRDWHFAHKSGEEYCSYETYLHILSKRLVKDKFDNSNTFEISYYQNSECCSLKRNCVFFKEKECCKKTTLQTYDLKKYYDTCTIEQYYDNYKPDILLTSQKEPTRNPLFIEILVTHKCEEKKRNSGFRIIEIQVKNEYEIRELSKKILTEKMNKERKCADNVFFAKFDGFRTNCIEELKPFEKKINRFFLNDNGMSYIEKMPCDFSSKKITDANTFEACIDAHETNLIYYYGYLLAIQNGFITSACCFCKYNKNDTVNSSFCFLYKKYGTPMNPVQTYAQQCKYFLEDKKRTEELKSKMPTFKIPKELL